MERQLDDGSTAPVTVYAYAHGLAAYPSGAGAYGLLVITPTGRSLDQGAYRHSTRDRMAIRATNAALRHCPRGSKVQLQVDNRRVYDAIAGGKLEQWRLDDWRARVGRRPIKDADLWRSLDEALSDRLVSVVMADQRGEELTDCVRRARLANTSLFKLTDPAHRRSTRTQPTASTSKSRPTRGLAEGDPCPKCHNAVTRLPVKGQARKPGQQFYWAWLLRCEGCRARYQTREGRRWIESEELQAVLA